MLPEIGTRFYEGLEIVFAMMAISGMHVTRLPKPEFDSWRWAQASELLDTIVPFKRDVYQAVLAQAAKLSHI